MPLYEIVLQSDAGAHEVRLTDVLTHVGETIRINEVDWLVVRKLRSLGTADGRFLCQRAVPLPEPGR